MACEPWEGCRLIYMLFFVLVVCVAYWLSNKPPNKSVTQRQERAASTHENEEPSSTIKVTAGRFPVDDSKSTLGTELLPAALREVILGIDAISTFDERPGQQDKRNALKSREWTLRSSLARKWSGTDHGELPIKALTSTQGRILRYTSGNYAVFIDRDWPENQRAGRNVKLETKRSVDALVSHGFLTRDAKGVHVITDKGLQALETLPTRYE